MDNNSILFLETNQCPKNAYCEYQTATCVSCIIGTGIGLYKLRKLRKYDNELRQKPWLFENDDQYQMSRVVRHLDYTDKQDRLVCKILILYNVLHDFLFLA